MSSKASIGTLYINNGSVSIIEEKCFILDSTRKYFLFDVVPMGAVRMSQSDRWKLNPNHHNILQRQRPEVTRYFSFKRTIKDQAAKMKYVQENTLEIVFLVPMPNSWSKKKKEKENRMPVKTRPDIDNYVKAFLDALLVEDGHIWKIIAEKRYAFKGSIIVYK